ncbi:MAG: 50S ribosome-binding GTPase [Planctomycetes bacterium]|nr:50S ribosome-binding GTPase [Planctomycetota bacterium]
MRNFAPALLDTQRYTLPMPTTPSFAFLTRALPAAVSIVALSADEALVAKLFSRLPKAIDSPTFVEMHEVDQGMLNRIDEVSWLFTPHGGLGVLNALRNRLVLMGLVETLTARASTSADWKNEILAALPHAASPFRAAALLRAYHAEDRPEELDALLEQAVALPLVMLCGAPNAGKSTLFNALASDREVIVSNLAGTTRDVVTGRVEIEDGDAFLLADSPGLRLDASSAGEAAGIALSQELRQKADLIVWVSADDEDGKPLWADLLVRSKTDQRGGDGVSAISGLGLNEFRREVAQILRKESAFDLGLSDEKHIFREKK